jgi:hypothetical protein
MNKLSSIAPSDLLWITGGASRVTSRSGSNDQLTTMLTQVTSSIKDLAANKNSSGDMMMPMMMMMMMGGGGGGGSAPPPPAAPPPAPPTISISNRVRG